MSVSCCKYILLKLVHAIWLLYFNITINVVCLCVFYVSSPRCSELVHARIL